MEEMYILDNLSSIQSVFPYGKQKCQFLNKQT